MSTVFIMFESSYILLYYFASVGVIEREWRGKERKKSRREDKGKR